TTVHGSALEAAARMTSGRPSMISRACCSWTRLVVSMRDRMLMSDIGSFLALSRVPAYTAGAELDDFSRCRNGYAAVTQSNYGVGRALRPPARVGVVIPLAVFGFLELAPIEPVNDRGLKVAVVLKLGDAPERVSNLIDDRELRSLKHVDDVPVRVMY